MIKKHVSSSNLKAVGYDENTNTLEVDFLNETTYQYYNVPSSVHSIVMSASSHGSAFDRYVKKAGYQYRRVA